MFHEESFITSLFKLLNLAALIGIGVYLFKTRVLSQIKESIGKKKAATRALHNEQINLKDKLHAIENEIVDQQKECDGILDRVERWQDIIREQQDALDQEAEAHAQDRVVRIEKQSEHIVQLKVRQAVVPAAFIEARKKLEDKFLEQHGSKYIHDAVRFLAKDK
jgi:hypothetical protein